MWGYFHRFVLYLHYCATNGDYFFAIVVSLFSLYNSILSWQLNFGSTVHLNMVANYRYIGQVHETKYVSNESRDKSTRF